MALKVTAAEQKKIDAASKLKGVVSEKEKSVLVAKAEFDEAPEDKKEATKKKYTESLEAVKKAKEAFEAARGAAAADGKFRPKVKEVGYFHVELDKPSFNPKTGKKNSKAFPQIFEPKAFNQFAQQSSGLGYTVKVLWNPEIYQSI
jgi:hypothetical protein